MRADEQSQLPFLRYRADWRTLLWAFALMPIACLASYAMPRLAFCFLPINLYVGFCAGVFAHNHNHCPTFTRRSLNTFFSAWISVFYGYPTFAWIPTHNMGHHKYVNRPGDSQITWRCSKKNNALVAATYFFVSSYWQAPQIREFVARAKQGNRPLHRQVLAQRLTVAGGHATLFALAVLAHDWERGAVVYLCSFGAAAATGLWGLTFINFIQHVHCDPWSEYDHSRNFVSKVGNFLVFNNGFHTAHHMSPGIHWSALPAAHAEIEHLVHPDLKQQSIFGFCWRSYVLGAIHERFRTRQIGRAAYDVPADAGPPSTMAHSASA